MTWADLEWLAGFGLPVIVKGVLHPDDARLAIDTGRAAVEVSNHGGRQLDAAIASLDALPAVVEAVATAVPILLDGGMRRGTDVLMALAMGATAVGIGRPIIWGLAVDGEAGVGNVLDLLTSRAGARDGADWRAAAWPRPQRRAGGLRRPGRIRNGLQHHQGEHQADRDEFPAARQRYDRIARRRRAGRQS